MRKRVLRHARGRDLWIWVVALFALVAALVGIAALSAVSFQQAVGTESARAEADKLQDQSYEIILAAEDVYDSLQDAERGQRGYVLTQNPVFLEPYSENVDAVEPRLVRLETLIEGSRAQEQRVSALRRLAELKLAEMADVVAAVTDGDLERASTEISSGYGRRLMVEIRDQMAEIRAAENQLLSERRDAVAASERASSASIRRIATIGVALLSAAIIAVIGLAFLLRRTRIALVRERYSHVRREALEAAVADRTHELTAANERLVEEARSRATAEDRLRQAQRMDAVGQLTGGIAHDFNNMLAVVIGSLDLLKRRVGDDPKLLRLIDNAHEGAERAATLTARLLAFSRQQSLRPEVVNVNQLVEGLRDFLKRTLGENVRIRNVLDKNTPDIYADASELENVIINLAANARDAMPGGGTLTIETGRETLSEGQEIHGQWLEPGTYASIAVTDTGEGMPENVLAKVFEPFFTTKPVGRGTGLGLSQVHGFVLQSGGALEIRSAPQEGTCIEILLPKAEGASAADGKIGNVIEVELPQAAEGETILVVEDQVQLRALTVDVLRDLGYEVEAASSATEALERMNGHGTVDLVFTDIVMPDQSGDELARQARAQQPDVKLLYASGYTGTAGVEATELDPPAELLRKPYTIEALALAVRRALDGP